MVRSIVVACVFTLLFVSAPPASAMPSASDSSFNDSTWIYSDDTGTYANLNTGEAQDNPHDGYDTGSNTCSVCHEDQRSDNGHLLLKSDPADDACNYCHIGDSKFSALRIYSLNPNGKETNNGHTIGETATIPDSSVEQWMEARTVNTANIDGNPVVKTINVRAYSGKRNKIFRLTRYKGQIPVGDGVDGYLRIGPTPLSCISCHYPHYNPEMLWRPTALNADGSPGAKTSYKLLRQSPSGSIQGMASINKQGKMYIVNYDEGMRNLKAYGDHNPETGEFYVLSSNIVRAPEETLTAENTGKGHTIYPAFTIADDNQCGDLDSNPRSVNQYSLSVWCADCHNLNIGCLKTYDLIANKPNAGRTHASPFIGAGNGPGQCYTCHRNDLPNTPGQNGQPKSLDPGYSPEAETQLCENATSVPVHISRQEIM